MQIKIRLFLFLLLSFASLHAQDDRVKKTIASGIIETKDGKITLENTRSKNKNKVHFQNDKIYFAKGQYVINFFANKPLNSKNGEFLLVSDFDKTISVGFNSSISATRQLNVSRKKGGSLRFKRVTNELNPSGLLFTIHEINNFGVENIKITNASAFASGYAAAPVFVPGEQFTITAENMEDYTGAQVLFSADFDSPAVPGIIISTSFDNVSGGKDIYTIVVQVPQLSVGNPPNKSGASEPYSAYFILFDGAQNWSSGTQVQIKYENQRE